MKFELLRRVCFSSKVYMVLRDVLLTENTTYQIFVDVVSYLGYALVLHSSIGGERLADVRDDKEMFCVCMYLHGC